ncbi:sulfatase-like hydrolase/transferase [Limnobacter sp.]|uniref:sulfatase-like hydrolase/transferase n=1 Tax=Limnobacter sp. TaxID=2003368 RepID=UPI00258FF713|nr:sulfatase-like hydrolase/transferase [Limnobacter sp.]
MNQAVTHPSADPVFRASRRQALFLLLALLFLNASLSFMAVWPTILVKPDWLFAPEFILLVAALSVWLAWRGQRPVPNAAGWLAGFYLVMVVAHYADVVVPNVLGREINLYWDAPQLPRFIWVTAKGNPWWVSALAIVAVGLLVWVLHRLFRVAFSALLTGLQPVARKVWWWLLVLPLCGVVFANYAGVEITFKVLCKPVLPTYAREAQRLWYAFSPEGAAKLLPPTTVVNAAMDEPKGTPLATLNHRDVMVMFLETYGAMLYDQPDASAAVQGSREKLEQAIRAGGRDVVSAFYTSPTVGGGSDLAHMSLLSGIDLNLKQPRRFDVFMTQNRPTLISLFRREGYQTFGLYHSVFWDWVERSVYGYDTYVDGPALGYKGPAFGYWKIPDQFAIARFQQMYPIHKDTPPRFIFFPTISTHFPFCQVPPYQPDWQRVLGPHPFDDAAVAKAQAEPVQWQNFRPDYLRTINYEHTWLAGFFQKPDKRPMVYILLGDHQPVGSVTHGEVSWDVPVFIVSDDEKLLDRFRAAGFSNGLTPAHRKSLGEINELTSVLLKAFGPN